MNIFNIQSRRGSTNKHIHHLLDHHRCSSSKRFFIQFQGEDDPQLGIVECHHSKYLISSSPLVWYKTNSHQSLIICKNHPEWMKSWGKKLYYLSPGLIKQRSLLSLFSSSPLLSFGRATRPVGLLYQWTQIGNNVRPNVPTTNVILNVLMT